MKTIIAGSRSIDDIQLLYAAVKASGFAITEVVSGGARGVDKLGEWWSRQELGRDATLFLPDKKKYGWPKAAFVRNHQMGDYAEALLAIWNGTSNGTRDMIEYARKKGLRVYVHTTGFRGQVSGASKDQEQAGLFAEAPPAAHGPAKRPISFTSESVYGILEGRKTQTRRVMYPQPPSTSSAHLVKHPAKPSLWTNADGSGAWWAPYGVAGDRLWGREVWARVEPYPTIQQAYDMPPAWRVEKNPELREYWRQRVIFLADFPGKSPDECVRGASDNRLRSATTLPRWASRLWLEIVEIRVERVQEISEEDAVAEGVRAIPAVSGSASQQVSARELYARVWDAINGQKNPWASNPFVWVISFRRLEA